MFTGIIEEVGIIESVMKKANSLVLGISSSIVAKDTQLGDSINVNGACQTVISISPSCFAVETVKETLEKTNLSLLKKKDKVNLERSLRLSDRLGGHLVSGHIDCVGVIESLQNKEGSLILEVSFPQKFSKYLVEKGSIAIEGISLTVVEVFQDAFSVSLIPFTWENTNLGNRKKSDKVNLEFDIIGKYVEKLIRSENKSKISTEWLKEKGW
jgi:riboflavin synthase